MSEQTTPPATDKALLDWLGKHPQCEVSYDGWGDDDRWVVHQVIGNRNDREWCVVGAGATVRAAIASAMEGMRRGKR